MKKIAMMIILLLSISNSIALDKVIDIGLGELEQQLKEYPGTVLLDIRDPKELRITGTIDHPKAHNISRGWLETNISDIVESKDTPIVVYCGKNIRSPLAAKTLMDMGYENVKNFDEGFFAWEAAGGKVWYWDKNQDSPLYNEVKKVTDNVYTSIGAIQPGSYENYGHNNNLSFVIGDDGVLVFNAGGSYILAQAFHEEIKKITDKPVKFVVYENMQSHAVLGSPYWKSIGAQIIAQENAKHVVNNQTETIVRAKRFLGNHYFKSAIEVPDIYFSESFKVPLKGVDIEILHLGPAHGDDEALLWMPEIKLLITGDFAFNERMLPVLPTTDINAWLNSWPSMVEMDPKIIIPGHGDVTDLDTATFYTVDYLMHLKSSIERLLDEDEGLSEVYNIDSSKFKDFGLYRQLNNLNLEKVYKTFEFEY